MVSLRECNGGIAKGLFMVINGLCILLAYCTFGFAVVDLRTLGHYGQQQTSGTYVGDVIVMCASLLLIVVAAVGLIGAIRNSLKVIYTYVALLTILILLEMLTIIFVAVQRQGLQFRVTEWLREDFFSNVTEEARSQHDAMWDDLQTRVHNNLAASAGKNLHYHRKIIETYECCGLNGPDDYPAIKRPVSLSCCQRAYRARTSYAQQELYKVCVMSSSYYTEGCEDEILFFLRTDAECLLGSAIFSFWVEGAGMLLAIWVCNNIKNTVKVYKQTVKY